MNPAFYEFLSQDDQRQYNELRDRVGSPENRYNRNKRLETFNEILDEIKSYCQRKDSDDWKRYLVCGVCWIDRSSDIAINTRQLRLLILKSKSTINGALAKMGYSTIPIKSHDPTDLIEMIPFLKSHPQELRQWTTRSLTAIKTPKEPEVLSFEKKKTTNSSKQNDNLIKKNKNSNKKIEVITQDSLINFDIDIDKLMMPEYFDNFDIEIPSLDDDKFDRFPSYEIDDYHHEPFSYFDIEEPNYNQNFLKTFMKLNCN